MYIVDNSGHTTVKYVCPKNKVRYESGKFTIIISENNYISDEKASNIKRLEKSIERFANTMNKKCESFNLINFINKIETTCFIYRKPFKNDNDVLLNGNYDSDSNTITFSDYDSLFHKLIHLSAQKPTKYKISRGGLAFNYNDSNYNIGTGIDEGLTELIRNRYFHKKNSETYFFELMFSKHIERLIGKDKLEKLYFDADYIGLLCELSQYNDVESTLLFLDSIDFLTESSFLEVDGINKKLYEECKKILDYTSTYLKDSYISKIKQENINDNEIYKLFSPEMWLVCGYVSCEHKNGNNILQEINFVSSKKFRKTLAEAQKIKEISQ